MMKIKFLSFIWVAVILLAGCQSAQKSLLSGNYEGAVYASVKKLRKKPYNEKFILILEEAYMKANQRDQDQISFLKKEGSPDNWPKIYDIYRAMQHRQNLVKPLLPLTIASEKRQAKFEIVNYDEEILQAKKNAAEFLYAHALKLMERNDRLSARDAYRELLEVKNIYANFRDVDAQIGKAKFMGTNKVLFRMVNTTGVPLPPGFEKELTTISMNELNTQWINYHTTFDTTVFYDYYIVVNMKVIDVAPEAVKEVHYKEEKKVHDGWEYVLDEKGNVKKDSLGNDIKKPKYKTISANVVETQQKKLARISGSVDYHNNRSKQLLRTFPVTADAVFEHNSAIAIGDLEALKPETKAKLKNKPLPFPNDFELLLQSGRTLTPMVKDIIWNNKMLITE